MDKSILKGRIIPTRLSFFSTYQEAVLQNPTKDAIIFENNYIRKSISYKRLDEESNRIAHVLQRHYGLNNSSSKIVAVAIEPSDRLPIILLAILKAGMTYLPLDTESPAQRIEYILQEAKPEIFIVETNAKRKHYLNVVVLTTEQLLEESKNESKILFFQDDETNLALILYTSGSTGFPKGVALTYRALMNRLSWQWRELPYGSTEINCIFKTALTFVDSVCEIWGPLLKSRTLVVLSRLVTKNPEHFIETLNKYQIQRIVLVPSHLRSILTYLRLQEIQDSLDSLKLWICSGETLSTTLVNEFFTIFSKHDKIMANFYGSTEVMGDVAFFLMKKDNLYGEGLSIPIGKPMDNCIVYIVDEDLNLVPNGQTGEMLIAGRNLASGYLAENSNQEKFIKNSFIDEPQEGFNEIFRTGDLAKIENSLIFYVGRQDTQVKIRGQKVDLTEIEKAILNIPSVEGVFVCLKADEKEQSILGFVKPVQKDFKKDHVEYYLSTILLPYMMPQIIVIDTFPLLVNGKIDRQKLLREYANSIGNDSGNGSKYDFSQVPEKHMTKAKILFPLLRTIIGNHEKCISISSNFYELGGNSLNSVYTVSKLRENGFNIGITDFITAKTLKDILTKMEDGEKLRKKDDDSRKFLFEMLNHTHKRDVISMITDSFLAKADLEKWLISEIKKEDYSEFIENIWESLVEKNLSFVVKSRVNQKILSVALNFDARDEPEVNITSKLGIIFDFLEFLERPIRDRCLPPGKNKIFHSFMMATDVDQTSAQNVILIKIMEQKCLDLAKKNNFIGILTTNTSPLTQQLGTDLFNYKVMLDYQVNHYETSEKYKPFERAPDSQRAVVSWKKIDA